MIKKNALLVLLCAFIALHAQQTVTKTVVLPKILQGMLTLDMPFITLPNDSGMSTNLWVPIPEMGFAFVPSIPFENGYGYWEFPIHAASCFPFLEEWVALSDVGVGAGFEIPPVYKLLISYRYISGRYYPIDARFNAHIASIDVKVPVRQIPNVGVRFEFATSVRATLGKPYFKDGAYYDLYEGHAFAIVPNWKFPLKYGNLVLAYRVIFGADITGTDATKNNSYKAGSGTPSSLEIQYVYP